MTTSGTDAPAGITAAVRASTFVTGATVIATDVAVVNGKSYTFIATPAADGDVDVGGSDAATMENLARAINLGPGAGTDYDIDTRLGVTRSWSRPRRSMRRSATRSRFHRPTPR
jgi:hypothetical protein